MIPRASRSALAVEPDGSLKIWVTAAPTDGQANAAVIELLARALGLAKSQVSVVSGLTSRHKRLAVVGLTADEIRARLADLS